MAFFQTGQFPHPFESQPQPFNFTFPDQQHFQDYMDVTNGMHMRQQPQGFQSFSPIWTPNLPLFMSPPPQPMPPQVQYQQLQYPIQLPSSPQPILSSQIQYQPYPVYIPVYTPLPALTQQPNTEIQFPPRGAASPAAIQYLQSIGLQFEPIWSLTSTPINNAEEASSKVESWIHPVHIFNPTNAPSFESSDSLARMIESGKLAVIDVEELAKLLRKKSFETFEIRNRFPTPFELFRSEHERKREMNLSQQYQQTINQRLPFLAANELEATYRSLDGLQRHSATFQLDVNSLDRGNFSQFQPQQRSYELPKEPYIIGQNRRSLLDRGTLFHSTNFQRSHNDIREASSQEQVPWNSGPPRRNDGTGSVTDLIKSRGGFIYKPERRRSQIPLVGNLPYRFPTRNESLNFATRRPPRVYSNQCLRDFETYRPNNTTTGGTLHSWAKTPRNLERRSYSPFLEENKGTSMLEIATTYPTVANIITSTTNTCSVTKVHPLEPGYRSKVILTKQSYYCKPSVKQLDALTSPTGVCKVSNFEIGHIQWGKVIFDGEFDVSGLNLDNSIEFGYKEVRLYTFGKTPCPPVNQGLNRPATVILFKVFPTNGVTKRTITDPAKLRHLNFEGKLRQKTRSFGWTFLNYNSNSGSWTYKVPYFNLTSITPYRREEN